MRSKAEPGVVSEPAHTVAGAESPATPAETSAPHKNGAAAISTNGTQPSLSLRGICKSFPGVLANDNIDLDVFGGEVHAVLGENGAGKTTLMKILYGVYQPDSGVIAFKGRETRIQSPNAGRRLGIGMVFQNFSLIPALTVVENVALFLPSYGMFLSRRAIARQIQEVSDKYGLQIDPKARTGDLSLGERQKVELVKLILARAEVLIFDEPTSVLAPHEVDGLFRVFDELKRDGYAVLFITHKIQEVLQTADRITVLRHGKVVECTPGEGATADHLVAMMLGIDVPEVVRNTQMRQETANGAAVEFRDVWTAEKNDPRGLHGVSFHVMPGEILGIAGISGNGQQQLGEVLLGLQRRRSGSVYLFGEDASGRSIASMLDAGVAYIPEDVLGMAMVPTMKVEENLVLGELQKYGNGGIWLDRKGMRRQVDSTLSRFPLKLAPLDTRVEHLSGGNIQRVVLARELAMSPKVLMAYYPTRGLDVLTAETTRGLLMECRDDGGAIVLVSEDLEELFALSDRLVVMYQGNIVGEFQPESASLHEIGLLMTGHHM
ncbi:MAG: ABC transporter ATP-binding protein [Chloroflexi bacterium]|nr:ABC transporter ATP-binding protein [Chloroflexota bacterium]